VAKPDWKFVQEILDATESQSNAERAREIVKKLGKRIGQRRREDEDVNQAAARVVREATRNS